MEKVRELLISKENVEGPAKIEENSMLDDSAVFK
jgi:hypothetical protein